MLKKRDKNGPMKTETWQCQKITRDFYSIDFEDQDVRRNHQECSKKIGNTNGSRNALEDEHEEQAWGDPKQD